MASRLLEILLCPVQIIERFADVHALKVEVTTALANVWLVPAEASCTGPAVPGKLPSWSSVVASEEDQNVSEVLLTCISLYVYWRCIIDMNRQLSKLFMITCLMSVHFMNFYQYQLHCVTVKSLTSIFIFLSISFYISVSYSGFTAVAFLKYMIYQEYLTIPVSYSGT